MFAAHAHTLRTPHIPACRDLLLSTVFEAMPHKAGGAACCSCCCRESSRSVRGAGHSASSSVRTAAAHATSAAVLISLLIVMFCNATLGSDTFCPLANPLTRHITYSLACFRCVASASRFWCDSGGLYEKLKILFEPGRWAWPERQVARLKGLGRCQLLSPSRARRAGRGEPHVQPPLNPYISTPTRAIALQIHHWAQKYTHSHTGMCGLVCIDSVVV
jgi:hypothetical protein